MKTYNYRKFVKLLRKNGFYFYRASKGSHQIFKNEDGRKIIIPRSTKDISLVITTRLIKENGLKE